MFQHIQSSQDTDKVVRLILLLTLVLSNIEVPELIDAAVLVWGDNPEPVTHIVLLQVLLGQVLQVPENGATMFQKLNEENLFSEETVKPFKLALQGNNLIHTSIWVNNPVTDASKQLVNWTNNEVQLSFRREQTTTKTAQEETSPIQSNSMNKHDICIGKSVQI